MVLMLRVAFVLMHVMLVIAPIWAVSLAWRGGHWVDCLRMLFLWIFALYFYRDTKIRLPFVFLHKSKQVDVLEFYFRRLAGKGKHDQTALDGMVTAALYRDFDGAQRLLALYGAQAKAGREDYQNTLQALLLVLKGHFDEAALRLDTVERPVNHLSLRSVNRDNFQHNTVRSLCRVLMDRGDAQDCLVLKRNVQGNDFVWRLLAAWALVYQLRHQEQEPIEPYRELVTVVGKPFPLLHSMKPATLRSEQA